MHKVGCSFIVRLARSLPDKLYLSLKYYKVFGKFPNWKNPKTFSEKLQWLKLYDRRPEYTTMVDKFAVKKYVADIIGEEYIIPTLGVWEKPEEIEWERLPNQFVLKTTHGGGGDGVVICKDKKSFDMQNAICRLKENLKTDLYIVWREWPYKNVPKRIIAEVLINSNSNNDELIDYKFFCFHGEPECCQVISGRHSKMCIDFFDKDWNHLPFHEPKIYPYADRKPEKPRHFEQMWKAAAKLSEGKAFSRIDFYSVYDKVFFSEITFFPTSGMGGFEPEEWDDIFGKKLSLPQT